MNKCPYLKKTGSYTVLMVNDAPFLPLGGEFYNSSTSSRKHMNEYVWPGLRRFQNANTYLAPVIWHQIEPQEGVYDFNVLDDLIEDARREKAHLILLWFGTYKNGDSFYIPEWLKNQLDDSYFVHNRDGYYRYMISPFKDRVFDLDAKAFAAFMKHLKETDSKIQTVVMVQLENEMGIMKPFHDPDAPVILRDECEEADRLFNEEVDEKVAEIYGKGSWKEVFDNQAERQFMAYYLSRQIEKIASAGKKEYPLPLFINSMPDSPVRKMAPSGGPDVTTMRIWKLNAPSVDMICPDAYGIGFAEVMDGFIADDNPIFIPECTGDRNSPSRLFHALGKGKALGYSVMGIDKYYNEYPDISRVSNGFGSHVDDEVGDSLDLTYRWATVLYSEIIKAHNENRIWWFSQQENETSQLTVDDYRLTVSYGVSKVENAPLGGGLLIRESDGSYLLFGINCRLLFENDRQVFVTFKQQLLLEGTDIVEGRILYGDELINTAIGKDTSVLCFRLYSMGKAR